MDDPAIYEALKVAFKSGELGSTGRLCGGVRLALG